MKMLSILYLEDSAIDVELVRATLDAEGLEYDLAHVAARDEFIAALEKGPVVSGVAGSGEEKFDIILADYMLPSFDGLSALAMAQETCPEIPFIMLSGAIGEEMAIDTVKRGATDYVLKQRIARLVPAIRRALHEAAEHTQRKRAEEALQQYHEHLEELVEKRTAELQQEIEDRKRTEVELRHAKEAALEAMQTAEAANTLKSEFLANMSHDIRTPLNAVLGFAEILKDRLRGFPQYHSFLNGIMDGGRTLLYLINDILDLSRIEAGRLEIRPEAVNLPAMLTEIQHMFASKVSSKGIEFILHISPDSPTTVLLDGNRLRQILVNLVGNAVKFTEKGSVTLRIEVCSEARSLRSAVVKRGKKERHSEDSMPHYEHILFEVEDTGMGIPQDEQERMFEAFQQHDSHSPGGTGLGLAITKRLVELMQGAISIESTVNEGTLFRVRLPATEIADRERDGRADTPGEQIHFHGATVLLAEDVASNRAIIREYVAASDLHLIEAEDGRKALQILTFPSREGVGVSSQPDLILMDIRMPVMDGYTAAQKIRNLKSEIRHIPIVALTAYAIKEQKEQYQDLYDAYLNKPISKHELIAALAEFLPHTKVPREDGKPTPNPSQERNTGGETSALPGDGILEALKDYAAQTGKFPQALLDTLHTEFLPEHKELSVVMSADGIIAFAEAVITVGDAFTIPPLKHYGEKLLHYTKVFDIINMKRLLGQFPKIVEIISKGAT